MFAMAPAPAPPISESYILPNQTLNPQNTVYTKIYSVLVIFMKSLRKSCSFHLLLLFTPKPFSMTHMSIGLSLNPQFPQSSTVAAAAAQLHPTRIPPTSALISHSAVHNSLTFDSLHQSKRYIFREDGFCFDPVGKRKSNSGPFWVCQMAPKLDQRRRFCSTSSSSSSSSPPDGVVVDPVSAGNSTIDAGSSMKKPISLWPGAYHSPATNALWEARSIISENTSNAPVGVSAQKELITKTPSRSRTSIMYKFSGDYILRELYRNPWNEIRMGKLLEDLDALAGTISFKHCCNEDGSTRPLLLVTASVDKMVLRKPIRVDTDLTIEGAVTWVGRSSLEIQLEVIQLSEVPSNPSDAVALTANFTFVARDSKTGKSAVINQVSPETEKEKLLWKQAEERNKLRKKKTGEQKIEIKEEEIKRLNEMLAEGRVFCDMPALANRDSILIEDTRLQNSLICQPQQTNIYGRIFGGFLMRRAFELAYSTAYAFAGSQPVFVEVDHVDFLKPVDVGNFLRLNSCVLYTELENPQRPMINVEVVAHVTRPELRSSEVSNKFYFTFTISPGALENGLSIRNVVPATEIEALRVIERMEAEKSWSH